MNKTSWFFIAFFLLLMTRADYTLAVASVNNDADQMQQAFDQDQHDDFIVYKNKQNSLPDSKREKRIFKNQYWLVNKKEDLWLGLFLGKLVEKPAELENHPIGEKLPRQQVIRIKRSNHISQFLLSDEYDIKSPPRCTSRENYILKDSKDYLLFFSGCIFNTFQPKSSRHEGKIDILLYDKTYDNVMVIDNFPYSVLDGGLLPLDYGQSINKLNGYYINTSSEYKTAFKVIGEEQVISVDPETGNKEDLDVAPPTLLKKLPKVTINK
ncbi:MULTISPECIES: hypothetical protein [unclassified Serratia (in: enterobacteria)]|uniref:hypothetical protein n=1 Tax=unclassified Serratia (in: enterobacteria) TaxID=2647522 RepID=UPI0030765C36